MQQEESILPVRRSATLYIVVTILGLVIIGRLFYLQVIQHEFYVAEAQAEHQSKFSIPASRGTIYALDGEVKTPLVLNEVLPTVYVDPQGIDDEDNAELAEKLAGALNVDRTEVLTRLEQNDSRYQIIKKQVPNNEVEALEALDLNGVGLTNESYRVYPQNQLASQTIGFVNDEGVGQYGVEEFLNDELNGTNGRFEAITDVYGIPLSTAEEQIIEPAHDGQDLTLTLDVNIQQFVEQALKQGIEDSGAKTGGAIVLDANSGAIKAAANYPTYNPNDFSDVEDFSVFQNGVVGSAYEAGSVIKVLTMAAALSEGVVAPGTTYYDPGFVQVDDRLIENASVLQRGINRTMTSVIQRSANTGVVFALSQLGGGEINDQARNLLYKYFYQNYGFGNQTGVDLAGEASGVIIEPDEEQGNNVRYANMSFGQGMTVTMLQTAAALAGVVNGGDYYQPTVIHSINDNGDETDHEPQVIRQDIVTDQASRDITAMMQAVVDGYSYLGIGRPGYTIGGKTGTAQVLEDSGVYSEDREIGSFLGFTGGDKPEYIIMTRVDEPTIAGYAGTVAAGPIFADISHFLIDYYQIPPQ